MHFMHHFSKTLNPFYVHSYIHAYMHTYSLYVVSCLIRIGPLTIV